jgi:hypothetical protein
MGRMGRIRPICPISGAENPRPVAQRDLESYRIAPEETAMSERDFPLVFIVVASVSSLLVWAAAVAAQLSTI